MVELRLLLSFFFLLCLLLKFLTLINGCLVLGQVLGLVNLRGYELLHSCDQGNSHFDIVFVLGWVWFSDNFFEEQAIMLATLIFRTFERLNKLLLLGLKVLVVA